MPAGQTTKRNSETGSVDAAARLLEQRFHGGTNAYLEIVEPVPLREPTPAARPQQAGAPLAPLQLLLLSPMRHIRQHAELLE